MLSSEESHCPRMPPDAPWLMSVSTGAILRPACRAWKCDTCGRWKAVRLGKALDSAGYDWAFTATNAPRDFRQGMARLRHRLAKHGPWEWVWSAERGAKTGMLHTHACVRGTRKSHANALKPDAKRAGFGHVWVREVKEHTFGQYAAKMGRYASKGATLYPEWRDLNGKRPWHYSNGYTGGVPMRVFVSRNAPARDPGPWRVLPAREMPSAMEVRAQWARAAESEARAHLGETRRLASEALARDDALARLKELTGARELEDWELRRLYARWGRRQMGG